MKVALGSDHAGYDLKEQIKQHLKKRKITYIDIGAYGTEPVDYPDYAVRAAKIVTSHKAKFGILICGTGIGMSMAANKIKGIRAAVCHSVYTAEMSRKHNNANILAIGARILKSGLAVKIVDAFISTPFEGGRHLRRVKKIGK